MNNGDLLRKTLCLRVRAPNTDVKERIRELNEILVDHKQCLRTLSDSKSMYIHTSYRVEWNRCIEKCEEEEKRLMTILKDLDIYIYKQSEEMNQYITDYNNVCGFTWISNWIDKTRVYIYRAWYWWIEEEKEWIRTRCIFLYHEFILRTNPILIYKLNMTRRLKN